MGDSRKSSRRVGEWRGRSHLRNGDGDGRSPRDGELVKQGWKPKRTLIYCAWDGEEPGLLGSTEWVETHVDDLKKHAVAYINSDSTGRGYLGTGGFSDAGKIHE